MPAACLPYFLGGIDVVIQRVDWAERRQEIAAVRKAVFVEEQGVPIDLELDAADPQCIHLLASRGDRHPVGTARMQRDGHIGRMAVLKEWRGKGIGSALLRRLVDIAMDAGLAEVWLNAQLQAQGFYEARGFEAEGEPFLEAGIAHRRMRMPLRPHRAAGQG